MRAKPGVQCTKGRSCNAWKASACTAREASACNVQEASASNAQKSRACNARRNPLALRPSHVQQGEAVHDAALLLSSGVERDSPLDKTNT